LVPTPIRGSTPVAAELAAVAPPVLIGWVAAGLAEPAAGVAAPVALSVPIVSVFSLAPESSGLSGGGAIPGARVNFGAGASAGTVARPTAARPAAGVPPFPTASSSTGLAEVPLFPDFACVSVIN
jgi:hypothetical protein